MSEKLDIRSYLNPHPRFLEGAQRAKLTGELYLEDRTGRVIDSLIASVRKGSIVEVVETFLLAPTKGRADRRRRILAERVEAIRDRGGCLWELHTGWRSKGQLPRMLVRAYEQIAHSGRVRKGDRPGRTAREVSSHERLVMEAVWNSRRYKNDDERLTAIEKRIGWRPGRSWMRIKFGSPHKSTDET